jgi:hypothetical protein
MTVGGWTWRVACEGTRCPEFENVVRGSIACSWMVVCQDDVLYKKKEPPRRSLEAELFFVGNLGFLCDEMCFKCVSF